MKANRKFLNGDDEAVSPVIAVILMVAITVVLAATVYVWVSGFGSSSNSPTNTMSMTSSGAITGVDTSSPADGTNDYYYKRYTISSASPSLTYGDMKLSLAGTQFTQSTADADCASGHATLGDGEWVACASATDARADTDSVRAGDTFVIRRAADLADTDLIIIDSESNSVMVTLKVR